MRMLNYQLTDMSAEGKAALPKILDEMGYAGRYVISDFGISINSNATVLSRAVKKAEEIAHKESGRLVCIRQTTYSKVWIPESEAATQRDAYLKAIDMVSNGWKVDDDPEISVKEPFDNGWIDSYYFEDRDGNRQE